MPLGGAAGDIPGCVLCLQLDMALHFLNIQWCCVAAVAAVGITGTCTDRLARGKLLHTQSVALALLRSARQGLGGRHQPGVQPCCWRGPQVLSLLPLSPLCSMWGEVAILGGAEGTAVPCGSSPTGHKKGRAEGCSFLSLSRKPHSGLPWPLGTWESSGLSLRPQVRGVQAPRGEVRTCLGREVEV